MVYQNCFTMSERHRYTHLYYRYDCLQPTSQTQRQARSNRLRVSECDVNKFDMCTKHLSARVQEMAHPDSTNDGTLRTRALPAALPDAAHLPSQLKTLLQLNTDNETDDVSQNRTPGQEDITPVKTFVEMLSQWHNAQELFNNLLNSPSHVLRFHDQICRLVSYDP